MPVGVLKKPSVKNMRHSRASNLTGSQGNMERVKSISKGRYDGGQSREKQRLKQAIKNTKSAVSKANQIFKANH